MAKFDGSQNMPDRTAESIRAREGKERNSMPFSNICQHLWRRTSIDVILGRVVRTAPDDPTVVVSVQVAGLPDGPGEIDDGAEKRLLTTTKPSSRLLPGAGRSDMIER